MQSADTSALLGIMTETGLNPCSMNLMAALWQHHGYRDYTPIVPRANSHAILILSAFSIPDATTATDLPSHRQAILTSRLVFVTI